MTLSIYDIAVPMFAGGLAALKDYINMAATHAEAKNIDPRALLDARLYPDMYSFTRQIQSGTDQARRGLDRLAGKELGHVPDQEQTFAELAARVDSTINHVLACDRSSLEGAEDRVISMPIGPKGHTDFSGRSYLLTFALPNFFFHVVTVHDILRHNGVDVGKRHFLWPFMTVPEV
ncbi:MAG: DUF1993 domain-containing protein [Proteobacteria bacterium]|nr:DUF1993 domain-containing protein [Pseudomonadota bacterium]